MKVIPRRCSFFNETLKRHPEISKRLQEFLQFKAENPLARFGSKDEHFTGDGALKTSSLIHAHLSRDISILYKRHGQNPIYLDLYAILSHQELGTGTPSSPKTQKKMVSKMDSQAFESKIFPLLQKMQKFIEKF